MRLLNYCPRLTHLSLTGVHAFLREEFSPFCRPPPPGMKVVWHIDRSTLTKCPEFNEHQRNVFCVFSGNGVSRLREYLNTAPEYEAWREPRGAGGSRMPTLTLSRRPMPQMLTSAGAMIGGIPGQPALGIEFDEAEADVAEDDDAFEGLEASEMALDAHPTLHHTPQPLIHAAWFGEYPVPGTEDTDAPVFQTIQLGHTLPPRTWASIAAGGASSAGGVAPQGLPASVAGLGLGRLFSVSSAASAASVAGSSRAPDQNDLNAPEDMNQS